MAWGLLGAPTDLALPFLTSGGGSSCATEALGIACSAARAASPSFELGAVALRHAPLLLLVIIHLYAAGADGAEVAAEGEECSKALGFNESSGVKDRSYQDLQLCDEHHKRTCCERNHTAKVRASWGAFASERSPRCAKMGQLAFCSVCDGDVGVGAKSSSNVVLLCPSFCARWFQACVEDFFAPSGSGGGLAPCGPGALVCSPLGEITEDAATFCARAGAPLGGSFAVAEADEEPDGCFDGIPAAKSRGAAAKAPWVRPARTRAGDTWWRRMLPPSLVQNLNLNIAKMTRALEDSAPQVVIACVAVFFAWYLWNSRE